LNTVGRVHKTANRAHLAQAHVLHGGELLHFQLDPPLPVQLPLHDQHQLGRVPLPPRSGGSLHGPVAPQHEPPTV